MEGNFISYFQAFQVNRRISYKIMNTSKEIALLSDQIVKNFQDEKKEWTSEQRDIQLKQLTKNIRLFNKAIRARNLPVGTLKKLQNNVGHLKRFKKEIEHLQHIGGGVGGGVAPVKEKRSDRVKWADIISVFQGRVRTGIIINLTHKDINEFFKDAAHVFKNRIRNVLKTLPMIKINTCFCGEFIRKSGDDEISEKKYFTTKNHLLDAGTDLLHFFLINVTDEILNALSEFSEMGSGWALSGIHSLEVNINKHEAGCGRG